MPDRATAEGETVDRLARAGFVAKGVLYAVVGVLAVQLAIGGDDGDGASQQGAITTVAQQPFGRVLVVALAVGLSGYALFRAAQVVGVSTASWSRLPGWLARATFAARALLYGALSVLAWREALGLDTEDGTEESLTAMVLAWPAGQWAVMAVGLVVVVVGGVQLEEAWTRGFRDHVELRGVAGGTRERLELMGRVGYAARGIVFLVAGGFLAVAAWRHDAGTGVGLDAALQEVAEAPFGVAALVVLGLGLVLFGCFCGVEARFLRPSRAD